MRTLKRKVVKNKTLKKKKSLLENQEVMNKALKLVEKSLNEKEVMGGNNTIPITMSLVPKKFIIDNIKELINLITEISTEVNGIKYIELLELLFRLSVMAVIFKSFINVFKTDGYMDTYIAYFNQTIKDLQKYAKKKLIPQEKVDELQYELSQYEYDRYR